MTENMSQKMETKVESKESISSLQKNQERWKVISGQEVTPKTLEALGGQEGVDLVKSGWEKQKTGAGFDKTGEELEALGGAVNVMKLEKLSNYSKEMGTIDKAEGGIVDPEVPVIGERNQVIYKVVSGYEWEDLDENEKKLLGDESYVELARSGWDKQSQKEGTGAMKSAEELMALTGRGGAGSIDALVEDMAKIANYNGQLMENGTKLNELFDLRKKIEEKYNLSQEEKDILNPPKEDEEKEPEFREGWENDEEKPDADDLPGETGGGDKKSEDGESDLPKLDDEDEGGKKSEGGDELPKLDDEAENEPVVVEPWTEGEDKPDDLTEKFERYLELVGRKTALSDEEKAERDELIALVEANREKYQDWRKKGKDDTNKNEDKEPEAEPVAEPVIEVKTENEDKGPKKVNKEKEPKVKKEKEPREKRGFWASLKRFFTESQFNEPTVIEINRLSDNFGERLKQIVTGHDVTKFKEYKSYASLEELQAAIKSGEHKYKYVENVTKLMSEADKLEIRAEKLHDQAEDKRRRARLKREAAESIKKNN